MTKHRISFRVIYNSAVIILFAAFLSVCGYATLRTYENYRGARTTVYIAYPEAGNVTFSIDQMAFIKNKDDVKFEYDTQYLGELSFTKGSISEDILTIGDRLDVAISDTETVDGTVLYIEHKEPMSMFDTEYKYYVGFDSDDFEGESVSVRMQYDTEPEEYEYTIPAAAVHSDSDSDYVFVVVPKEGVMGTEYITKKVKVTVWPRDGSDEVALLQMPDELIVYPTVMSVSGSLRSKNSDGAGVSVNIEEYK